MLLHVSCKEYRYKNYQSINSIRERMIRAGEREESKAVIFTSVPWPCSLFFEHAQLDCVEMMHEPHRGMHRKIPCVAYPLRAAAVRNYDKGFMSFSALPPSQKEETPAREREDNSSSMQQHGLESYPEIKRFVSATLF